MLILIFTGLWAVALFTTAAVAACLPPDPPGEPGGKLLAVVAWGAVGASGTLLWTLTDLALLAAIPVAVWYAISGWYVARCLRAERAALRARRTSPPLDGTW